MNELKKTMERWDSQAFLDYLDQVNQQIKEAEEFLSRLPVNAYDLEIDKIATLVWLDRRIRLHWDDGVRPLVEAPLQIRVQCYAFVPKFVDHGISLAKQLYPDFAS